jgi:hypothetical protein
MNCGLSKVILSSAIYNGLDSCWDSHSRSSNEMILTLWQWSAYTFNLTVHSQNSTPSLMHKVFSVHTVSIWKWNSSRHLCFRRPHDWSQVGWSKRVRLHSVTWRLGHTVKFKTGYRCLYHLNCCSFQRQLSAAKRGLCTKSPKGMNYTSVLRYNVLKKLLSNASPTRDTGHWGTQQSWRAGLLCTWAFKGRDPSFRPPISYSYRYTWDSLLVFHLAKFHLPKPSKWPS